VQEPEDTSADEIINDFMTTPQNSEPEQDPAPTPAARNETPLLPMPGQDMAASPAATEQAPEQMSPPELPTQLPAENTADDPVLSSLEQQELEQQLVSLEDENELLRSELDSIKKDASSYKQQVDNLKKQIAALEKQAQNSAQTAAPVRAPAQTQAQAAPKPKAAPKPVAAPSAPKAQPAPKVAPKVIAPSWEMRSAQPGQALLLDSNSGNVITVEAGQVVNGLGRIQFVGFENGKWVVRGTQGSVER
jgi:hypothetical protein